MWGCCFRRRKTFFKPCNMYVGKNYSWSIINTDIKNHVHVSKFFYEATLPVSSIFVSNVTEFIRHSWQILNDTAQPHTRKTLCKLKILNIIRKWWYFYESMDKIGTWRFNNNHIKKILPNRFSHVYFCPFFLNLVFSCQPYCQLDWIVYINYDCWIRINRRQ